MPLTRHYPSQSYDQLFRDDAPAWRLLRPEDDASHQLTDGGHQAHDGKLFEWWYFDAESEDGHRLVVEFHTAFFGLTGRPPVLAIRAYHPDGSQEVAACTYRLEEVHSSTDRCDVRLGDSRVWDAGDHYVLDLALGQIKAHLEYRKELDGVQVGTGALFDDRDTGQFFRWIVPLPCARVSGTLWIDGRPLEVNGAGYHDHNWGNVDLCDVFDHWIWGRVTDDEQTLIFGHLVGRGHEGVALSLAALWKDGRLLFSSDDLHVHTTDRSRGSERASLPPEINMAGGTDSLLLRATFYPERELDVVRFVQPRYRWRLAKRMVEIAHFVSEMIPPLNRLLRLWIGYATYCRYEAGCELVIDQQGQREGVWATALCEKMGFHSAP